MSTPSEAVPAAPAGPENTADTAATTPGAASHAGGAGASSAVEQRLAELGLTLPDVAAPVAASGDTVDSAEAPSVPAETLPVASSLPLMNGSWPEV